ncbi:MarR family transcriptional regulator [Candidatus Galacturonibacter soehngenii]|uniref:MarR family transcriptional regulator n=2 Tax=Candidatus Galacturonatibacter soehngenii TaxID=2307010 RepID=A0A7V7QM54_9FIRM|nr:MarR family transcriptional regulator [Candidatus Galacturonibacter soehngenii]
MLMYDRKSKEFREKTRILERNLESLNSNDCSICSITSAQCHALVEIGRRNDSMLKDLATTLRIDISTASKVVEELVKKGLVLREPSTIDRRSVQINLSEEGKHIFDQIENNMDLIFEEIFSFIDPQKQDELLRSLSIYNQAIEQWKAAKENE